MRFLFVLLLLITFGFTALSQSSKAIKEANIAFRNMEYHKALSIYLKHEEVVKKSADLIKNVGDSYYYNSDLEKACGWYKLLTNSDKLESEYLFRYILTLKSQKRYREADSLLNKLGSKYKNDSRIQKYKKDKDYIETIRKVSGRYTIKNININTEKSEFGPMVYGNKLIYSSTVRKNNFTKNISNWTGEYFIDLKTCPLKSLYEEKPKSKSLKGNVNSKFNESTPSFTPDGNTMYFTRNKFKTYHSQKGKLNDLKIYKSTRKGNKWEAIEKLSINGTFSSAHASISRNGKKMYFASDRSKTGSQSDLFVVNINADGSFGKARNLGNVINTEGRETFPHITESNKLYFASDGQVGLGGLDIFVVQLDSNDNVVGDVQNIGFPVNSSYDDFAFIINEKTHRGFFSSNRKTGKGNDDIYSFTETKTLEELCTCTIQGIVLDSVSREPITNSTIYLYDDTMLELEKINSDSTGRFKFKPQKCQQNYLLKAGKPGYSTDEEKLSIISSLTTINRNVVLEIVKKIEPFVQDSLEPIYFDLNSSVVRKTEEYKLHNIVGIMLSNPEISIEIRAYTDSRASSNYNNHLSKKRAMSTKYYLVEAGVHPSNIKLMWFGESSLLNNCYDGVPCSEQEHQLNRRVEFRIIHKNFH